ncbi:MAG TPA: DUF1552 domain-containing protein [Polyangiaceae bacterium]|jgi:hypothetical protein|nr:DUF1552 domain-containing protein [Polyangiaceae bacterium]
MKRRIFLQGLGGAALVAPFLPSVAARVAKAQTATSTPVRQIIFYTHNGCNTNLWFPVIEDGPLTAADLSPTLQPLADYVDKLLLPRGFKSFNAYTEIQSIDPHNQAMGSKLTCAEITEDTNYATAMSMDHEVAHQLNPNKASPLMLSVGQKSTSIKEVVSFSGPGEAYVSETNPAVIYNQLTDVLGNATGSGGTTMPTTDADYQVMRGKSIIDLVKNDLNRYQALNMSSSDKQRIQAWLDLLRTTEQGVVSMATASCGQDVATLLGVTPEAVAAAGTGVSGERSGAFALDVMGSDALTQSFTVGGDMMLNLIALSAICDTNRSMGMIYPGYCTFNWDGIKHTHDHHGLSHRNGDFRVGAPCVGGVMEMIGQIDNWYAGKYTRLVKMLNDIPEGDVTLLDNTATIWLPELSDGNAHNQNNLPILIAGSAGGKLKQGVAVNVEGKMIGQGSSTNSCQSGMEGEANSLNTGSRGGNVPINKLYCTLMNAYGMKDADGNEWSKWGKFDSAGTDATAKGITNPGDIPELKAT